ncbi:hypothetical protein GH714_013459 [Hevea brasiliensis]|uniref:Uncharacterized protein n=1 Tax=Hevea brasiliensis TaxID=3981 RepID=A0A6A6KQH5_HEVBR|nr:hypothetical protein GH714_013459 [Hevea brasiliensis]
MSGQLARGKGESSGKPEAPHSPEGLDADLVRHKTIEDNYAWAKKLLLLEALSATQMVQEKFKLLRAQEDVAMDKLADTHLDLQSAVMAGLSNKHPGVDFGWVKDLLPKGFDFAAVGNDEEERVGNDADDGQH